MCTVPERVTKCLESFHVWPSLGPSSVWLTVSLEQLPGALPVSAGVAHTLSLCLPPHGVHPLFFLEVLYSLDNEVFEGKVCCVIRFSSA